MINGTFSETSKIMNTSDDDMSVIFNVTFLHILYQISKRRNDNIECHSILALVLKLLFYGLFFFFFDIYKHIVSGRVCFMKSSYTV